MKRADLSAEAKRPSLLAPASMDPAEFSPSFDVVWVMDSDKEKYVGDKPLSMSAFPAVCRTNIDRLRPHMKLAAGIHPITAACVFYGVSAISRRPGVKALLQLKYRFDCAPKSLNGVVSATIAKFLTDFSVTTPNGKRQNVNLPAHHHSTLARIARELGIPIQSLAILAILYTLTEQQYTNEDDKKEMAGYLERFFEAVEIRARGAKVLMDEFKIPEVANSPVWSEEEFYD